MADGLITVWKEKGYTSHDVIACMRGILHQKKIGHTGTLDPQAEGVLPVGLGVGTRLLPLLPDKDKSYEAEMSFGFATDTQDIWGTVTEETGQAPTEEELREVLPLFTGEIDQVPPMYSAKKVNGKKLYDLAREGITIERKPVTVSIRELELLSFSGDKARIRVTCSTGTYIRTLIYDIGLKLGCLACMSALVRTRACGFGAEKAVTLQELERIVKGESEKALQDILLSPDEALSAYPALLLPEKAAKEAHNGNTFRPEDYPELNPAEDEEMFRVYLAGGGKREFIGLYGRTKPDLLKPVRIFYRNT